MADGRKSAEELEIQAFISTVTGNTRKLAEAVIKELNASYPRLTLTDLGGEAEPVREADVYIFFFWCRRASMDPLSAKTLDKLSGKEVLAIGTMGSYPESAYGREVHERVKDLIGRANTCLGVFLSQGAISRERTEARLRIPQDRPHHLTPERLACHIESRKHPDEKDMKCAAAFALDLLKNKIL